MKANWTAILNKYIHKLVSPDGRQTYESKPDLVNLILELAKLQKTDKVIDLGCGWGNFLKVCSNFSGEVIGIEPNSDNLKEAANRSGGKNIKYIQGSFENLNYKDRVNKIISMLAFHQVPWDDSDIDDNILKTLDRYTGILYNDAIRCNLSLKHFKK